MQCGAVQATAAGADEAGNAASALLAASQASAQLKASLLQEQQIVSTFLHHFCEKVPGLPAFTFVSRRLYYIALQPPECVGGRHSCCSLGPVSAFVHMHAP